MPDELEARLRAVERALVEGEAPPSLEAAVELATRVERMEERLDELAERQLATEAAVRAVQGSVGEVRPATRAVERRADRVVADDDVRLPGDPPVAVPPPTVDRGADGRRSTADRRERR